MVDELARPMPHSCTFRLSKSGGVEDRDSACLHTYTLRRAHRSSVTLDVEILWVYIVNL